ncbi:MAG: DUF4157 domain-containing protein [Bacteroidota bacterium]|nr:DUF4157 domain-containing protein [Bacteroidota bacterium]
MNEILNVRENSWIAKWAAKKLKSENVAIVIGKTIHLHNVSRQKFLADEKWVKHESCHLKQFKENGTFIFILKYLWESARHGYYNNKYEVEARKAEE